MTMELNMTEFSHIYYLLGAEWGELDVRAHVKALDGTRFGCAWKGLLTAIGPFGTVLDKVGGVVAIMARTRGSSLHLAIHCGYNNNPVLGTGLKFKNQFFGFAETVF